MKIKSLAIILTLCAVFAGCSLNTGNSGNKENTGATESPSNTAKYFTDGTEGATSVFTDAGSFDETKIPLILGGSDVITSSSAASTRDITLDGKTYTLKYDKTRYDKAESDPESSDVLGRIGGMDIYGYNDGDTEISAGFIPGTDVICKLTVESYFDIDAAENEELDNLYVNDEKCLQIASDFFKKATGLSIGTGENDYQLVRCNDNVVTIGKYIGGFLTNDVCSITVSEYGTKVSMSGAAFGILNYAQNPGIEAIENEFAALKEYVLAAYDGTVSESDMRVWFATDGSVFVSVGVFPVSDSGIIGEGFRIYSRIGA